MKLHIITLSFICIIVSATSCENRRKLTVEEQVDVEKRYNKTQEAVSSWILNHALYPKSYEALSFSEYSEPFIMENNEKIPKTQCYRIKHIHHILDTDSSEATYIGYFTLDYKYRVTMVETLKTGAVGGMSLSDIKEWTDKYGKPLSEGDSSLYKEKQQEAKEELIHTLKSM
ncbi:hypothetical protein MTX78_23970 (plasmid) [Hymenobacter tibetensis]|uniref:DUF4468 domain-containing protein n=1 Tax=Hymenobacter tibetensis TaxID=497967 RepID=A0ABY4D4F0_9BACT|nr:hypothetical protein [Hymenobacter tibetensis]UOG77404.1 hypothetical protein MTX78_23970 [Hymenobacter tibetensis]